MLLVECFEMEKFGRIFAFGLCLLLMTDKINAKGDEDELETLETGWCLDVCILFFMTCSDGSCGRGMLPFKVWYGILEFNVPLDTV